MEIGHSVLLQAAQQRLAELRRKEVEEFVRAMSEADPAAGGARLQKLGGV